MSEQLLPAQAGDVTVAVKVTVPVAGPTGATMFQVLNAKAELVAKVTVPVSGAPEADRPPVTARE